MLNTTPTAGTMRMGDWKLVTKNGDEDLDGGPAKNAGRKRVELFNLRDDPYEKDNLAERYSERVKEMETRLKEFARQAVPPKAKPKLKDFVAPKVWGE